MPGGVVFKGRQLFSDPPLGGSANMTPGPGLAAPPGKGAGRACSDQTEQMPGGGGGGASSPGPRDLSVTLTLSV